MTEARCSVNRADIVVAARKWIGTPYRHQAALNGVGCDCLGLVRGLWRDLYGNEPEAPGPYSPNWAEELGEETMRDAARRHMMEFDAAPLRQGAPFPLGCILLIRIKERGLAKHAVVAATSATIVHAYSGHAVAETAFPAAWRRRIAYAFDFPGLTD